MHRAIVLLSGGLDSAVTAAIAVSKEGAENLAFLHVNYGQRTEGRELRSFNEISDHYGVEKRLVADISYLKEIGGSALTDESIEVPEGGNTDGVPITYVPFRNAHLLAIAVSWAEVSGAVEIYMGAVEEDSSGYPDCREEFFGAFAAAVSLGTKPGTNIRIITPLIHMRKPEIVKKGVALAAPLHLTWSCYADSALACGVCDSCILRLRGFSGAGMADPIPYRAHSES
ncbi:MAG: 7-cyano-7-deazaguanine synthase QueC [Thermodesulfobacteriota bacterium]|nr:MAG: 7-cyano-7-deazaguanine synthase QueC [Thermodesulfobacteriota bacterium]